MFSPSAFINRKASHSGRGLFDITFNSQLCSFKCLRTSVIRDPFLCARDIVWALCGLYLEQFLLNERLSTFCLPFVILSDKCGGIVNHFCRPFNPIVIQLELGVQLGTITVLGRLSEGSPKIENV